MNSVLITSLLIISIFTISCTKIDIGLLSESSQTSGGNSDDGGNTFGVSGIILTNIVANNSDDIKSIIPISGTDQYYIWGNLYDGDILYGVYGGYYLAKINSDGSLVTSWGENGFILINNVSDGYLENLFEVKIQSDGKILVSGDMYENSSKSILYRFNVDGTVDNTFGTYGVVKFAGSGSGSSHPYNIQLVESESTRKILISGIIYPSTAVQFLLVRFNDDGSLDTSFDGDGYATATLTGTQAYSYFLNMQGDSFFISGTRHSGGVYETIVKFNSNGSVDASFGNSGSASACPVGYSLMKVKTTVSGEYFLCGYWDGTNQINLIHKLDINGADDASFGDNGTLNLPSIGEQFSDFTLDMNENIFAALSYPTQAIYKYNSAQDLDTTFGNSGIASINLIGQYSNASISQIMLNGGYLLISGSSYNIDNDQLGMVLRLNQSTGAVE